MSAHRRPPAPGRRRVAVTLLAAVVASGAVGITLSATTEAPTAPAAAGPIRTDSDASRDYPRTLPTTTETVLPTLPPAPTADPATTSVANDTPFVAGRNRRRSPSANDDQGRDDQTVHHHEASGYYSAHAAAAADTGTHDAAAAAADTHTHAAAADPHPRADPRAERAGVDHGHDVADA